MSNIRLETKFIVVHSSQTILSKIFPRRLRSNASQRWVTGIGYHKIIKRDGTIMMEEIYIPGCSHWAKGEVSNQIQLLSA